MERLTLKLCRWLSKTRRFFAPRRRILRFINIHDYNFPHERDDFEQPMMVQDRADPAASDQLFQRIAEQWRVLGSSEPYWSVITAEKYKRSNINLNSFRLTGAKDFKRLTKSFERCGCTLADVKSVLELGCGVGRVTQFLAEAFTQVNAVDISKPHLDLARNLIEQNKQTNVTFITLTKVEQVSTFPRVDLFYSIIALQHNPPPIIRKILEGSLSVVAPGGYAYFQILTQALDYKFDVQEYLAHPKIENNDPEMHALPQQTVFKILSSLDFDVLEVRVDASGDPARTISNVFFAKRRTLYNTQNVVTHN